MAAVAVLVIVSVVRVIVVGWAPVAPDDAMYIGVGRLLWFGQVPPLGIDGTVFTIRAWADPLVVGGASRLIESGFGGDPFTGPRLVNWLLGTTALALAVVYAYRSSRVAGAVATTAALLATPLLWTVVPSTLIENALLCSVMVTLLLVDRPTTKRMLAGGVLAGVTLLVKETSAFLLLLPIAYLGLLPRAEWWRLAKRFVVGWLLAVGWWFALVLVVTGDIFPLEGFRQVQGRQVPRGWTFDTIGLLLAAAFAVGWVVLAIGRRHDARARILIIAGAAFLPAATIAWVKELAMRQFAPLALLSCVAVGIAIATCLDALRRRSAARTATALTVGLITVALVTIVLAQTRATVPQSPEGTDKQVAEWLAARPGAPRVVSTFRYHAQVWARLSGTAEMDILTFQEPSDPPSLGSAVAVDWRREHYTLLTRDELGEALTSADYVLLTGPHRLGPIGLATWLNKHGATVGLNPVRGFVSGSNAWAYIYRVNRPRADLIPTVVSTTAALRMSARGDFHATGPTAIAGTRDGFRRLDRRDLELDGIERLDAPLR